MKAVLLLDLGVQRGAQLWHALIGPILAVCRVAAGLLSCHGYGLPRGSPEHRPCSLHLISMCVAREP